MRAGTVTKNFCFIRSVIKVSGRRGLWKVHSKDNRSFMRQTVELRGTRHGAVLIIPAATKIILSPLLKSPSIEISNSCCC